MEEKEQHTHGYITLKEAAELSGYSADYIGQLIRKKKLPGKQVYLNIAWVTTEEAIQAYMRGDTEALEHIDIDAVVDAPSSDHKTHPAGGVPSQHSGLAQSDSLEFIDTPLAAKLLSFTTYALLTLGVCFLLFLFYLLAIFVDKRMASDTYHAYIEGDTTVMQYESPPPRTGL